MSGPTGQATPAGAAPAYRRPKRPGAIAVGLAAAGLWLGAAQPAAAHGDPRPAAYQVSSNAADGLEGIEVTHDGTIYVTSVFTGAVFRGSVRDPQLSLWLPAGSDGRDHATGIHVDRWGRVLIAGAMSGTFWMYAADGTLLATRQVPGDSFLNDFAMTRDAIYVTDSGTQIVYRAELTAEGIGQLQPFVEAAQFGPKAQFINGIVVTPGERYLLVVDWLTNTTWRVDLSTRAVTEVAVTGGDFGGDGLLLQGHRADVVQTDWVTEQSFVRSATFSADFSTARVTGDSARVALFDDGPTTIARDRGRLLWVLGQLNDETPELPYVVAQVPRS